MPRNTQPTIYSKHLDKIEGSFNLLRQSTEKGILPFVEKQALSFGLDMSNTQWTLSLKDGEETEEFDKFHDFMNTLSDEYGIEILFIIENGKFQLW